MKITVIGETCTDIFIYLETKRLSPEAPVPIVTQKHLTINKGMAGNVVSNLNALSPSLTVKQISQKSKITKTRYIDDKSNHMFMRLDEGDDSISSLILEDCHIEKIKNSDVVIVSDYNKGFISDRSLIEIGKLSKFSVLDTKRIFSEDIAEAFNIIKVNEDEYLKNKTVADKFIYKVLITLGKNGVKYMNSTYPSKSPKETIDVSGAGDTFTAAFTLKYMENQNLTESIRYANEMASIVVSKRGVTTP